jgi:hypothetical protein
MLRNAGDSALRAAQRFSLANTSGADSSVNKPAPRAAASSASTACGSVARSPSASIISNAPASSISAPPISRARRMQAESMNSSIAGATGCAMIRATAAAALATSA